MTDKGTIGVYDDMADDYARRFSGWEVNPRLAAFIAALPKGGAVLDLGCGPGAASAAMAQAGLKVTALDASRQMARIAKETHGIDVVVAGFDWVTGEAEYDGVWASFSLLHAPREEMAGHLARLHKALKPGGRLMLGLKRGTGAARDSIGRLYTYYEVEEVDALLRTAGFTPFDTEFGEDVGLDGTTAPWLITHARA
ncbi:MAG: class I SAM-dependent methyltransferase [Pseudomonadota bacterium]